MAWLATQPDLSVIPRERTGGGALLAFICRDIPDEVMKAKKAPTCQINYAVTAELYLEGLNLVLSPSVHKSGHTYSWEVTGDIPEVKWAEAQKPGIIAARCSNLRVWAPGRDGGDFHHVG